MRKYHIRESRHIRTCPSQVVTCERTPPHKKARRMQREQGQKDWATQYLFLQQYCVTSPLRDITAAMRSGMLAISSAHVAGVVASQMACNLAFNPATVRGRLRRRIFFFIRFQRVSIGLKSGLLDGHGSTSISCSGCNQCPVVRRCDMLNRLVGK